MGKLICEGCGKVGKWEIHPCPFNINVYEIDPDDKSEWCNCCPDCEGRCIENI